MAIANGTCISFCNQPKAQFGYLESRRYVVAFTRFCGWGYLATSRESKIHFGLTWVRQWVFWDNRGKCYIHNLFNACQTHRSMYPSIFNRLRAITRYWSEIATFSYPLAPNAPVGGVPIGIPGKVWTSEN